MAAFFLEYVGDDEHEHEHEHEHWEKYLNC